MVRPLRPYSPPPLELSGHRNFFMRLPSLIKSFFFNWNFMFLSCLGSIKQGYLFIKAVLLWGQHFFCAAWLNLPPPPPRVKNAQSSEAILMVFILTKNFQSNRSPSVAEKSRVLNLLNGNSELVALSWSKKSFRRRKNRVFDCSRSKHLPETDQQRLLLTCAPIS